MWWSRRFWCPPRFCGVGGHGGGRAAVAALEEESVAVEEALEVFDSAFEFTAAAAEDDAFFRSKVDAGDFGGREADPAELWRFGKGGAPGGFTGVVYDTTKRHDKARHDTAR